MPPNLALKDQRFALKWIHDNIQFFNGNPNKITIAGEDAGAISVGLHILGKWEKDEKGMHFTY